MERNIRKRQRAACAVDAEHVGIVFLVGRVHKRHNLRLVPEGFREQRANGAIDLPRRQNFLFARAAFALDEAAGDASAGVGELAILNGQREEVDAFLGVGRSGCGCKHGVVAAGRESGAGRLLGQTAGLEFDVLSTGKLNGNVLFHVCFLFLSLSSLSLSFLHGPQTTATPPNQIQAGPMLPILRRFAASWSRVRAGATGCGGQGQAVKAATSRSSNS